MRLKHPAKCCICCRGIPEGDFADGYEVQGGGGLLFLCRDCHKIAGVQFPASKVIEAWRKANNFASEAVGTFDEDDWYIIADLGPALYKSLLKERNNERRKINKDTGEPN